jgi:hypothetical protein
MGCALSLFILALKKRLSVLIIRPKKRCDVAPDHFRESAGWASRPLDPGPERLDGPITGGEISPPFLGTE